MTIQISIIGLGQVGSSIGLALAGQKNIKRVGHDKDIDAARAAQKAGAVDETHFNLPASVENANLVLLCLPLEEIRRTLEVIAPDLQEGTVVMDTAPSKATVASWAGQILGPGRYYVGLVPAASAGYLQSVESGVASARADMFNKGLFIVTAPSGTPGEAVNLATDLAELLGAKSMISDALEADGLLAWTHFLPQLAGAALLDATTGQPGWREARKLAARPYAMATAVLQDSVDSLGMAALENRQNIVRVMDAYIDSLKELRDKVGDGDVKVVSAFLEEAARSRERWFNERSKAEWDAIEKGKRDVPSFSERMGRLFVGNLAERSKKK